MPMPRSGRPTNVVDANEHHTAVAVGQTHDGIDEVVIAQRLGAFGQKLGGKLFTAGEQAANVLLQVRLDRGDSMSAEEQARFKAPTIERYEHEGSPYFSTARLWDDGVIDPLDTRRVLAMGIEAALHAPIPETRFGVFRM